MSAFIQHQAHIDAILTTVLRGFRLPGTDRVQPARSYGQHREASWYVEGEGRTTLTADNASEVGRVLMTENVKSVTYRYEDDDLDSLPGPVDKSGIFDYTYKPGRSLTHVEMFKALDGYDYQACEHPEYRASLAYTILNALRDFTWSSLPGYDDADGWSIGPDDKPDPTREASNGAMFVR